MIYSLVDALPVGAPEAGVQTPLLVMVHQVGEPLPRLWDLLLHLEEAQGCNGAVGVMGLSEVGELNLRGESFNL